MGLLPRGALGAVRDRGSCQLLPERSPLCPWHIVRSCRDGDGTRLKGAGQMASGQAGGAWRSLAARQHQQAGSLPRAGLGLWWLLYLAAALMVPLGEDRGGYAPQNACAFSSCDLTSGAEGPGNPNSQAAQFLHG